ncbi:ABC transporter ATP-binding protein [Couchioplanes azureus]|uniref:ABC transporter ATP-binding protein n=1 Tax=Couchioplanes caeruleus TaxID=56438 RepID=UPI00199223A3|nr:ABC transporter ATP-binding protein [Couchioplanes caeruleus]GGQ84343.1 multidrug ABC transporter ATP-binding protein [Couchioplanes caeruleus subsp. azureus]
MTITESRPAGRRRVREPSSTTEARSTGLMQVLGLLAPYRGRVVVMVIFGVVGVALGAAGPLLLGRATDLIVAGALGRGLPAGTTRAELIAQYHAQGRDTLADVLSTVDLVPGRGMDFSAIGKILALAVVVYVAASAVKLAQDRMAARVVQLAVADLRERMQEKLSRLPLAHFDRHQRGDLVSRVTNDVDNVQQTLQQALGQVVTAPLTVLTVLVLMFFLSPLLALVVLVSVPLSGVIVSRLVVRSQPLFDQQWAATGTLSARVEESYSGHSLIKIFDQRTGAEHAFDADNETLRQVSAKATFLSAVIEPAMMFVGNLNYVAVTVVGAVRVATGNISLGDVQAFVQYSGQFSQPIGQLASASGQLQSAVASAARIFALLEAGEQQSDPVNPQKPTHVRGRVEFRDVSFRYAPDTPLIEHLSLIVEPGSTVAIVGPTGAGKSTLANLLMRFYEVDDGRILLDHHDISTMSRADLRSRTGMVLQDTWLFAGTIADNIAYGRAGVTRDDVVAAARATCLDPFVCTLPQGYDTVLDEDATGFSAGEKQLITLARAFLADPVLLLLDEATSSVDTRTEALIQQGLSALRAGRTTFVIAHRLSTIRHADVIIVMRDGAIVEQGSHDELLRAGGAYAGLVRSQDNRPVVQACRSASAVADPSRPGSR